jgi:hypothetical protein
VRRPLDGRSAASWRRPPWAAELSGCALDTVHHMSEEAPGELTQALLAFMDRSWR